MRSLLPLKTRPLRTLVALCAASLALVSLDAWAHNCPLEMNKIDRRLQQKPNLSPQMLEEVKRLRAEGERLHRLEKHAESMLVLGSAKKILGID